MKRTLLTLCIGTLCSGAFSALATVQDSTLEFSNRTLNDNLPSASGVVVTDNKIFAVGDDSPWLYQLDSTFTIVEKDLIKEYPVRDNGRIVKKVKPDFEALDNIEVSGKPSFVMLGSGSKLDVREWAFVISQDKQLKIERSLKPLYKNLRVAAGYSADQEINVEGLATSDDSAFILNRGNGGSNVIFELDLEAFQKYLVGAVDQVNDIKAYHVNLPVVAGFEAGLSGAEYWQETESLVVTASIEATGDAYNDGEILGSYIGLIDLDKLSARKTVDLSDNLIPLMEGDKRLITKLESVAFTQQDEKSVSGVVASDNDDGTSEFFNFTLTK
ncbi:hypothetical protein VII00023_05992 [Vibrio ichthyoenteri ATCC 700023]|uniref:Phytase-like domain-containing protein n=1 Tax=Vibrio ichthyoenteri ATCC 700023 TaxID=870968 RepID=F9S2T4_9VIBR|nr:hypothetical protein [Vibrio ichthyoenteri]EGU38858.1 hypothetical protein VII00023_05992 [Vibrio ichthyoenteri ATCC 700023]